VIDPVDYRRAVLNYAAMAGRRPKRSIKIKRARVAPAVPAPQADLIKMSELAKRSGVPAPTIKHYIREGLLPGPEVRTSRNMAYYDARLAARIRVIKELQAARFLPLRVIGELLEPAPSDRIKPERDAAQRKALTALLPAIEDRSAPGHRRKRSEVMKTFGVTKLELERLERAGVLELRGDGETAGYSGIDLRLLDILGDVHRLELGDVFPISIAEPYMAAVKQLVEFEIDVFRHRALSSGAAANLPELAHQAVALGERLILGLRAKLLPGLLERLATQG
jgi:DNA-binding transcriptional MerR regulator